MLVSITTGSSEDTIALGTAIGKNVADGTVIALTGGLGSGKTALTQGIAGGMDIGREYVTSPSYTLINHYPGNGPTLYHVDLYQLSDSREVDDLGLDEILHKAGVVVIEWAEKFGPDFWKEDLTVEMKVTGETERKISLASRGPLGDKIITALSKETDIELTEEEL